MNQLFKKSNFFNTAGSPGPQGQQLRGAFFKLLSCICFAIMNGITYYGARKLPVFEVVFFQNFFGFLFLLPFLIGHTRAYLRSQKFFVHIVRVLLSCFGMLLWALSLKHVPMAYATALGFTGPIISLVGAIFFLRERVTNARLIAIFLGVIGGALIAQARDIGFLNWGESATWTLFLPLGAAALFSTSTLLNKYLTNYDQPLVIVAHLQGISALILGGFTVVWGRWPEIFELLILATLGGVSALANYSLTQSFSCSDLTFLMPIGSMRFILTAIIGVFIFNQPLNIWIVTGFIIISLSLGILALVDRKAFDPYPRKGSL
jgi:drug/metabolite transporter (DMT)-like permease